MSQNYALEKDWFSKPGDSLRLLMQRRGLTFERVASELTGGEETLRGIFGGSKEIGGETAEELVQIFGGSTSFWIARQTQYNNSLDERVNEAAQLEPEQWLDTVPDPMPKRLSKNAELELYNQLWRRLNYFNVPTYEGWFEQYGKYASETTFRESPSFESRESAKLLWLRRGELEADLVTTESWNPEKLRDKLPDIRRLTRISKPTRFLTQLRSLLATCGVALAVVKAPQKCPVSGAVRMIAPNKAMLLVSFRYRSDEQFWFTIFHEIGHLLLHEGQTFVDDDYTSDKDIELEANEFAAECVIPSRFFEDFHSLKHDRQSILRFSTKIGIAPGLVVGQLQHHKMVEHNRFNTIKRFWNWADIKSVEV